MCDTKLQEGYMRKIKKEVAKLKALKPKQFGKNVIDKCVEKSFEKAYIGRLHNMYTKSKQAQAVDSRRMFFRLKRLLFRQKCIEEGSESHDRQVQRLQNYSYKLPHCSEDWESSWRDQEHPLI